MPAGITYRSPVVPARGLASGLVFAGVALIATCYGFARFAYGLFAPRFAEEFALPAGLSGVIGSGSYVGYCLAIGVITVLTARWGPRPIAVLAGSLATGGITVVAVAPSAVGARGGCAHRGVEHRDGLPAPGGCRRPVGPRRGP